MKIFFGVNTDLSAEDLDGAVFETKSISSMQEREIEARWHEIEQHEKRVDMPLVLRLLAYPALIAGLGFLRAILEYVFEEGGSLGKVMIAAPWMLPVTVICLAYIVWFLVAKSRRAKHYAEREEFRQDMEQAEKTLETSLAELGVPKNCTAVDVLYMNYKEKNGEPVPKAVLGMSLFSCNMHAFVEDDCLCLSDITTRWDIPLECCREIITVHKRVNIGGQPDGIEKLTKEQRKKYGVGVSSGISVGFKYYHALIIERDGERYELYFAPYDIAAIERLTGLTACE